jgi:hypothetical protein
VVIIGVAAVALVATLLVSNARKPTPRPTQVLGTQTQRPSLPAPAGTGVSALAGNTLVAADAGTDIALAPFSGTRRTLVGYPAVGYPDIPVRSGHSVVFVKGGTAYVLTAPFADPPQAIGPADHLFPALTEGAVGVWQNAAAGGLPTVELLALPGAGTTGTAPAAIPFGLRPQAELPSGILVWDRQGSSGLLQVWQAAAGSTTGTFIRTLGIASAVVGWSGDRVAWLGGSCTSNGECPLHITDAATGGDVTVAPPPGYAGYLPGGAFSPTNNQLLALYVYNPVQRVVAARLVLVSFTPGSGARPRWTPALVPQGDVAMTVDGPPLSVVWTLDGAHVLFSGSYGRIHDYQPGNTASYPTDQPASTSFTVVPDQPATSPSPSPTGP